MTSELKNYCRFFADSKSPDLFDDSYCPENYSGAFSSNISVTFLQTKILAFGILELFLYEISRFGTQNTIQDSENVLIIVLRTVNQMV